MSVDKDKQQRALEKARQVLLEAERARQKNRVGHHLHEFIEGKKDLLREPDFADNVGHYLFQMYQQGERSEVLELIPTFGACASDSDEEQQKKGPT